MDILAIAGGTPSGEAILFSCCFLPIMPLAVGLAGVAVYRNSLRAAAFSLILSAIPFLLFLCGVAGYEPSSDPDVVADQAAGRSALGLTAWPVTVAGLLLLWVARKHRVCRGRKQAEPPPTSSPPAEGEPGA